MKIRDAINIVENNVVSFSPKKLDTNATGDVARSLAEKLRARGIVSSLKLLGNTGDRFQISFPANERPRIKSLLTRLYGEGSSQPSVLWSRSHDWFDHGEGQNRHAVLLADNCIDIAAQPD